MPAHIHHEREHQVYDHGRSEGKEGYINKEQSDAGCGYAELFTQACTHAKGIFLKKMLYAPDQFHTFSLYGFHLPE
jgi:hypothetical protein